MNAVEFIRRFGWNDARVCILNCACPEDRWIMRHGELISDQDFDDLKRYVEAYELVESYGGLDNVKNRPIGYGLWTGALCLEIEQAIALVEEI